MGRKKKAFAVLVPALALIATACQEAPGAAAGPYGPQTTQAANPAAYPARPAEGNGIPNLQGGGARPTSGTQQNGGGPQDGAQPTAQPTDQPTAEP
ncbi:hypothetical protein ETD96_41420, partial [Actinomadura geliboluensis]